MILENIIDKGKPFTIENNKIYNFLNASPSSKFYEELFLENLKRNQQPELYDQVKAFAQNGMPYTIMEEITTYLQKELNESDIVIEIGGGVDQERAGDAYKKFKHYFPLDISHSSIRRYTETFNKIGFVCDATQLPFKDNSIDCIFTHTFLEHPLDPNAVLKEISRVLKPNGIVVHNDAWFCRWWHRYGFIGLKKFNHMSSKEKLIYILAQITEVKIIRYPPIMIKRLWNNFFKNKKNIDLSYQKLKPNYNLHLGCDEDAASSIDPIDVIRFYESRDFVCVLDLSFRQKLLFPNKFIILKKGS